MDDRTAAESREAKACAVLRAGFDLASGPDVTEFAVRGPDGIYRPATHAEVEAMLIEDGHGA